MQDEEKKDDEATGEVVLADEPEVAEEKAEEKAESEAEAEPEGETKEQLQATVASLQKVIKGFVDTALAGVSDEDRKVIIAIGGKDSVTQLNTYNALKAAGKLGGIEAEKPPVPAVDQTRIASGGGEPPKPKSVDDARRGVVRQLSQLK